MFFFCLVACFYRQASESVCVRGSIVCAEPVTVTREGESTDRKRKSVTEQHYDAF